MAVKEWHSRGYLPHWEAGEIAQSITFRLGDSLPAALLDEWRIELERLPVESATLERRTRVQIALDQGHGSSALAEAAIADIVEETLLYFDTVRYRLHA